MRETLVALNVPAFAAGEEVLLVMPIGGGPVVALTLQGALNAYDEGWLEGWAPVPGNG